MTTTSYNFLLEKWSQFISSLFIDGCERLHTPCKISFVLVYIAGKVSIKVTRRINIQPALDRNCVHVCCDRNIVRQINYLHYFEDRGVKNANAVGYRKKIHIVLLTAV